MVNRAVIGRKQGSRWARLCGGVGMVLAVGAGGQVLAGEERTPACDYADSLKDPTTRNNYLAMKAEMELVARVRMEGGMNGSRFGSGTRNRVLDPVSRQCIDCHEQKGDGALADIGSAPHSSGMSGMAAISATHAIGTDYVAASANRWSLRKPDELPAAMTLVDGRIACITCHNPLNPQRYNLAVDSRGSELCLACHQI